jgi:hypothetical protein
LASQLADSAQRIAPESASTHTRDKKGAEQMIMLAAVAVASLLIALVALLRAGIVREDSEHTLRGEPPTLAAALTRRVVGLYVRMPKHAAQADPAGDQTDAGPGRCPPPIGSDQ